MNILLLIIVFFFSLSIVLFDFDYTKSRQPNDPKTPKWIGLIYFFLIGSFVAILFISWKIAVLGVLIYYLSAFIPIPQIVGNFLMSPFKPSVRKKDKAS